MVEARWTLAQLGLKGHVKQGDIDRLRASRPHEFAIAAYTLNELPDEARSGLRSTYASAHDEEGAR